MNRKAVKQYIDSQPIKAVSSIDLDKNKITCTGIKQHRTIKDITGDEEVVGPL